MRLTSVRSLMVALVVSWFVHATAAAAGSASIEDFYGAYEGKSVSSNAEGLTTRDIGVTIKPRDRGFNVTWTTLTHADDRETKRKTYSIDFEPTGRPNIFASAMRMDMFGKRVPLNPLKGDPYVWSTLSGETLTVYALLITPDGGYEMQTYERTLSEEGLHLEFSRIREGLHLKYITGTLVRIKE